MAASFTKTVSVVLSVLAALVQMWLDHKRTEKAKREVLLEQRLENLRAKEIADAIDNAPVPRDKYIIIGRM